MVIFYILLIAAIVAAGVFLWKTEALHLTGFVGIALIALLIPAPVYGAVTAIAKADQTTFHEYWNGFETGTSSQSVECLRDGACTHEYNCDPYTVVETEYYTDSEGDRQSRTVTKTKWHDCPYSSEETSYYVDSTLRTFTIASHLMTGAPFRAGKAIPNGQVLTAPAEWLEAKARVDAGKPGGVTMVSDYTNYILASERSLFNRYSDRIDELKAENLLPSISAGVQGSYKASKAYFVGNVDGVDTAAIVSNIQNLNGAVGAELHGDLHVVFVDTNLISLDKEDYSNALIAYWQSKDNFGRDALAKNSIVLIVGVEGYVKPEVVEAPADVTSVEDAGVTIEGETEPEAAPEIFEPTIAEGTPVVAWAEAFTGMPVGNEALLTQFSSELPETVIDKNFIGNPTYNVTSGNVVHTDGVVENILYGVNTFARVSMTSEDSDDEGTGFAYLGEDWEPDVGTLIWFYSISAVLFLGILVGAFALSTSLTSSNRYDFLKKLFGKA